MVEVKFKIPKELFEEIKEKAHQKEIGLEIYLRLLLQKGLKVEKLDDEDDSKFTTYKLHDTSDMEPVKWTKFKADRTLFWSSPEELPLYMVICTVLRAGRSKPLFALLKRYGSKKIEYYLELLRDEVLIKPEIYKYMKRWIEMWKKEKEENNRS